MAQRRHNLMFCGISSHRYVLVPYFSVVCQKHSVSQPHDHHHQKSSTSSPPAIHVSRAQIPILTLLGKPSLSPNLPLQHGWPPKQEVWRGGDVTWEVTQGNRRETSVSTITPQLLSPTCMYQDRCSLLAESITFVCSHIVWQGSRSDHLQLHPTHWAAAATARSSPRHK